MAMEITKKDFQEAALVVVVDKDGKWQWSSTKTDEQVFDMLCAVQDDIISRGVDRLPRPRSES